MIIFAQNCSTRSVKLCQVRYRCCPEKVYDVIFAQFSNYLFVLILRITLSEHNPKQTRLNTLIKYCSSLFTYLHQARSLQSGNFRPKTCYLEKENRLFHILNFKAIFYLLDGLFKVHHSAHQDQETKHYSSPSSKSPDSDSVNGTVTLIENFHFGVLVFDEVP